MIWPTTSQLSAFEGNSLFKVKWQRGQMARKPKTWVEWNGDSSYVGQTKPREVPYDYAKFKAQRLAKENAEKEEAIRKGVEEELAKLKETK